MHKNKSKSFTQMIAKMSSLTIQVCFDMMHNQTLPELSVTDTFHSRHTLLYNLIFVIMSKNN